MIYLIDDNQNNQRLNNYQLTFIEDGTFSKYITSIEHIEKQVDLTDTSHLNFLKHADCILLHTSFEDYNIEVGFIKGSRINAINIKEIIAQEGDKIPLVLFSNSMGKAVYEGPDYISQLKKNIFYERLYDFICFYKDTGKIELKILAYGKNYISGEISELANTILTKIVIKKSSVLLRITDLSSVMEEFEAFVNLT